jgi:hypothetical protein
MKGLQMKMKTNYFENATAYSAVTAGNENARKIVVSGGDTAVKNDRDFVDVAADLDGAKAVLNLIQRAVEEGETITKQEVAAMLYTVMSMIEQATETLEPLAVRYCAMTHESNSSVQG